MKTLTLKQQVCRLDLAKRLKELGVKQESQFYWKHNTEGLLGPIDEWVLAHHSIGLPLVNSSCHVAAFTVAELGEMLPPYINVGDDSLGQTVEVRTFTSDRSKGKWDVWYEGVDANDERCDWYYQTADTEADARAKMLIYLLENKLVGA